MLHASAIDIDHLDMASADCEHAADNCRRGHRCTGEGIAITRDELVFDGVEGADTVKE
jgi:hypothetical protein